MSQRVDVEARAIQVIRAQCDQHDCQGVTCAHRNHRRDQHFTEDHLAMLGLTEDAA